MQKLEKALKNYENGRGKNCLPSSNDIFAILTCHDHYYVHRNNLDYRDVNCG